MKFIVDNWTIIVLTIFVIIKGYNIISEAIHMPKNQQIAKVKKWLLYAVTKAEANFGGGTGKIKLSYCYDLFVSKFSYLSKIISFDKFSALVDEVLDDLKDMLSTNEAVKEIVDEQKVQ